MFSHCFYLLLGPGTNPIRFVLKIRVILRYLCVRSSDVVSKLGLGELVFDVKKAEEFARPPNLRKPRVSIEPEKPHNAIWSRLQQISAGEGSSATVSCQKGVFLWRTTSRAPEH